MSLLEHLCALEERLHYIRELFPLELRHSTLRHLQLGLHQGEALRKLGHLLGEGRSSLPPCAEQRQGQGFIEGREKRRSEKEAYNCTKEALAASTFSPKEATKNGVIRVQRGKLRRFHLLSSLTLPEWFLMVHKQKLCETVEMLILQIRTALSSVHTSELRSQNVVIFWWTL